MTAGTRPSRRTERAAPLPVPLRVTAASCLIAAMMLSLMSGSRPASRGVGDGARRRLIGEEAGRGKSRAKFPAAGNFAGNFSLLGLLLENRRQKRIGFQRLAAK